MRYGLYVFIDRPGHHRGPQWIDGADEALKAFVGVAANPFGATLTDTGDNSLARSLPSMTTDRADLVWARWSLLQAPRNRWALLRLLPMRELQCSFCKEVFLPSRRDGEGDPWEIEQHVARCCSDACWERGLQAPKTLRYRVELLAHGDGAIREVKLPAKEYKGKPLQEIRSAIMHYGQNDVQPQLLPSVSVGDVIQMDGDRWKVVGNGFEKVPDPVAVPYDDRDQT